VEQGLVFTFSFCEHGMFTSLKKSRFDHISPLLRSGAPLQQKKVRQPESGQFDEDSPS